MNSKNVFEIISFYLYKNGIKQRYLSEKTGISENILSAILNGKRKMSAEEFIKIIFTLNVDANYFVDKAILNTINSFKENSKIEI